MLLRGVGKTASAPAGCAEATSYIARTTSLVDPYLTGLTNLICTLVSTNSTISGTLWSRMDIIYARANQDATNAVLNLKSSSFPQSSVGSPSYSAPNGWTLNGSSQYQTTAFAPRTDCSQCSQNSTTLSVWVGNNRTTASTGKVAAGAAIVGSFTYINPLFTGNVINYDVNGAAFPSATPGAATAQGMTTLVRTASTAISVYRGTSSLTGSSGTSALMPTTAVYIGAYNNNGTPASYSDDTILMMMMGAQVSATDVAAYHAAWGTYFTAIGATH